ncbi:MAG: HTH-type transcriptional repressor AcnR [Chloroflexi bacterium]|nr:HTH-type transcriptional repressor AcnR [Chloroflexota bacterium]
MAPQTSHVGRDHILEKAEQLFTKHGYQGASIRKIADACGVTNAALYYHFTNKEALFVEVIKQHAFRLGTRMRQAGGREGSYQERVTAMAQEYMELMSERRSLFHLLRHKVKGMKRKPPQEHFGEIYSTMFGPIEEILQEAIEAGELRSLPENYSGTSVLLGMLHGVGRYHSVCNEEELKNEDVHLIVDIFWNGMSGE